MGSGRKFNKINITRPTKSSRDRNRRHLEQKRRLIALGMDEAEVAKLNVKEIRTLLQRPAKIQAAGKN